VKTETAADIVFD